MHKVALLNGEFCEAAESKIDAVSSAAFYGRGVFTTVAIYNGEPFLWEKHLERLRRDAEKIGIAKIDLGSLENSLIALIQQNVVEDGRARITIFDSSSSRVWKLSEKSEMTVLIVTGDRREMNETLCLTISPFPVNSHSPLAGVKSCNYLENLIGLEEANSRGFDEAVRINERGEIASGCMANLFWMAGGRLFTPAVSTGCLPGTTREFVMENLDCKEVSTDPERLQDADSIFICSAGLGIRQVSSLDTKSFEARDHAILHLLPKHTKTRMSAS
jgi:branched-subunit amino acid aminotransferase/4-amino-4-deoxychorismate lyase